MNHDVDIVTRRLFYERVNSMHYARCTCGWTSPLYAQRAAALEVGVGHQLLPKNRREDAPHAP